MTEGHIADTFRETARVRKGQLPDGTGQCQKGTSLTLSGNCQGKERGQGKEETVPGWNRSMPEGHIADTFRETARVRKGLELGMFKR